MIKEKCKVMIVGAGECNSNQLKELDLNEYYIIAADGGFHYLFEANINPDCFVGDMDSLYSEKEKQILSDTIIDKIILPTEKDDTDMLAALQIAMKRKPIEIHIFGAMGGRLDHTFANLQVLCYIRDQGFFGIIHGLQEDIIALKEEAYRFLHKKGLRMSLFSIDQEIEEVTLEGFKYPLVKEKITNRYPIGISNIIISEDARITIKGGMGIAFIEKKNL